MRMPNRHNEKGIALILSILALLLLSAIAVGMMYMSTTEASINANFKAEETEYFAARAGVEEVRDRMLPSNPNTINNFVPVGRHRSRPSGPLYSAKRRDHGQCDDWTSSGESFV